MSKLKTNKPVILVLSHCLLNQKVRAHGLTQHPEIKKKILKLAKKYDIKIKQLPCPEFLLLGEREPKTYDEYIETVGFKDLCEKLAEDTVNNIKKLGGCPVVVIGIARSPSCSISCVYDRYNNLKKGEGIFIHFLREKMSVHPDVTPKTGKRAVFTPLEMKKKSYDLSQRFRNKDKECSHIKSDLRSPAFLLHPPSLFSQRKQGGEQQEGGPSLTRFTEIDYREIDISVDRIEEILKTIL